MREITAYILAIVKTGKEYDLVSEISKMEGVREVLITYGTYDLVIRVEVGTLAELDKLVTTVRKLEGVERTETLIGV